MNLPELVVYALQSSVWFIAGMFTQRHMERAKGGENARGRVNGGRDATA